MSKGADRPSEVSKGADRPISGLIALKNRYFSTDTRHSNVQHPTRTGREPQGTLTAADEAADEATAAAHVRHNVQLAARDVVEERDAMHRRSVELLRNARSDEAQIRILDNANMYVPMVCTHTYMCVRALLYHHDTYAGFLRYGIMILRVCVLSKMVWWCVC